MYLKDKMLTLEQKACNAETLEHILKVNHYLNLFIKELLTRGNRHDRSKLETPEVEMFTEVTAKLAGLTYGSEEYNENVKRLGPALEHHYAKNSHHPQHFKNGINDMNLLDVVEMFCDWKAATLRHNDGNIRKSIEINAKRFNMSDQLKDIFENTAALVDD